MGRGGVLPEYTPRIPTPMGTHSQTYPSWTYPYPGHAHPLDMPHPNPKTYPHPPGRDLVPEHTHTPPGRDLVPKIPTPMNRHTPEKTLDSYHWVRLTTSPTQLQQSTRFCCDEISFIDSDPLKQLELCGSR